MNDAHTFMIRFLSICLTIDIPRLTSITHVSDFDIVSMVHIKTSLSLQDNAC